MLYRQFALYCDDQLPSVAPMGQFEQQDRPGHETRNSDHVSAGRKAAILCPLHGQRARFDYFNHINFIPVLGQTPRVEPHRTIPGRNWQVTDPPFPNQQISVIAQKS